MKHVGAKGRQANGRKLRTRRITQGGQREEVLRY